MGVKKIALLLKQHVVVFHAFLQVDQHGGDQPHEPLEPVLWVVVSGDYVLAVLLVPFVCADPKSVADLAADILVERATFPVRFGQRQPAQTSVGNPSHERFTNGCRTFHEFRARTMETTPRTRA